MNAFADILKAQMKKTGVSIEKLCEGLCSQSMFTRICNGERSADKLLRERLMQRLGLSDTRNESFLFRDEYEEWKLRQHILNSIVREQFDRAEELLRKYKSRVSMENHLERQFCLVMETQILTGQGCGADDVKEMIERALKLTVPNIDTKPLRELILSEQEIDLVIDYVRYSHPEYLLQCSYELLEYIKRSIADEYIQARIVPKIVYYQCIACRGSDILDWNMILRNCNNAIACLRNTQRLYYFWELLLEREKLYEHFVQQAKAAGEKKRLDAFNQMQEENALWKQTVEEMYKDCGMHPAMKNNCYLYLQRNTFCINDLIYKRRTMLGMTRKELCDGICSEKTIARVELTDGKMQLPIAREVLGRLGMSGEYQRVDIITSNPDALKLVRDIATHGYNRDYEKEKQTLEKLEGMISMEEPINRQYVKKTNTLLMYDGGKISVDKVLDELVEALEYTVSLKTIRNTGVLCLTKEERTCVMNIARLQGNEQLNEYYEILWKICEEHEKESEIAQNIGMYEFIMTHIASVLGNMGKYEESNAISRTIIRENAFVRRFGNNAENLYNIAYNYKAQNPADYDDKIWRAEVGKSALLFHMAKCYNLQKILEKELLEN